MPAGLLIKSYYSYLLKKWRKIFPPENILSINGNLLTAAPWAACSQVEKFLELEEFFDEDLFTNAEEDSKFYCIKQLRHKKYCSKPGGKKGRTLSQNMTEKIKQALTLFYDAIS